MTSPPPPARTPWPLVLLLVGAGVVAAFQIGKAPAALPALRSDLGLSLIEAGWVISMFNVIGIALGMLIGAFADQLGHRRMVLGGLAAVAASSLLGAAAPGSAVLLLSRFVEGLGFIVVVVATPGLIVRATAPSDLKLAFGAWGAYMPAGTATMMLVSPAIIDPFGWRGLWIANAAIVGLFTLALAAATRAMRATGQPRRHGGVAAGVLHDGWRTLTSPGPPLLALIFASYTLQFLAVFGFLPTIMIDQGVGAGAAAALSAFAIAVNVIGNLAGGVLLSRGLPRWGLIAGASLAMGLCALGIYQPGLAFWPRYGLAVALSLVGGMIPASVLGAAPVHAPAPRLVATTNGLIMQGSNLGQTVGPPALAALASATGGWQWSPAVLMSAALVCLSLSLVLRALDRRRALAVPASAAGAPR